VQGHGHDGLEAAVVEHLQHQRYGEPLDNPFVDVVLEGMDDLLADALVFQGRPRALEAEVDVLALLAHQRRKGGRQPATSTDGAADPGEGLEARAAQYIARPPPTADAALGVSLGVQGRYDSGHC
jgi:hypothetical protein